MTSQEIRQHFLDFFKEKGHAVIPSASLIPENDPTVLFTTAGMHPLVPYLLGQRHAAGTRLVDAQKCLRTDDIDEVGDNRHLTFFEMLGNWSLGDYFKREAIAWSFEFLTSDRWLGLDPKRLFVTVFSGDTDAPRDDESINIWQAQFEIAGIAAEIGIAERDEPTTIVSGPRIYAYPKNKNWWPAAGVPGPCGPDTEMFYDTGAPHGRRFGAVCHPNCDCGRFVEIWNNVFMEYQRTPQGAISPLLQKNVDTGMGLERIAAVMQRVPTVFETNIFRPIIQLIESRSGKTYNPLSEDQATNRSFRIIADHVRAATFVIGDERGVVPSNVGQGYIVRRLLRRAIREGKRLGIQTAFTHEIAAVVVGLYSGWYSELAKNAERIYEEMRREEEKFQHTLEHGLKELEKMLANQANLSGTQAFLLFSSYGFPLELTEEIVRERGGTVDRVEFDQEFQKHQELSRSASAGVFKGGLADHSLETTRLHTATHLLHEALRQVLGDHVEQRGSNITSERLRFDFSHPQKLTPDQLQIVEQAVNKAISQDMPVRFEEMTVAEAKALGVIGLFEEKYAQLGDKVKVYFVGDFSKEICGGPHVLHTGEIGQFKIIKEEAVSAGIRRIKAVVQE